MPARQSKQAQVLKELQEQSRLYARKATLLSNLLEQAEHFLSEMPGKVAINTQSDYENYELSFLKTARSWRLMLEFREDGELKSVPVTQASILQKAEAAKRLPELYRLLQVRLTDGQAEIDRGLQSLQELPFLDLEDADHSNESDVVEEGAVDDIPF